MSTISYRLLAPPVSGSLTPYPEKALRLRALGRPNGPGPHPGRRAHPALLLAPMTMCLPRGLAPAAGSSPSVPADKPSVATLPAVRLHGARPFAPAVTGINPGLIPAPPAQTGHHVFAAWQNSDRTAANAAAAPTASPPGAHDGAMSFDEKVRAIGLAEVRAFVVASTGVPQQPGAMPHQSSATALQRDSDRQRHARAVAQNNGLRQLSLTVPDDDDVRSALKALAKGLASHRSWRQAMLSDPAVAALTADHALLQRRCEALSSTLENTRHDAARSRARADALASQMRQAQPALDALPPDSAPARTREQAGAALGAPESGATGQRPALGAMTGLVRRLLRQGVYQAKGWIMLAARHAARLR
jgi:hypothetical protein